MLKSNTVRLTCVDHRIIENPELLGAHKDHRVQLLAPHRTTQSPNLLSESNVQTLLEPLHACPLTQLHPVPLGLVAVTESRAQRCLSAPCEELQLP